MLTHSPRASLGSKHLPWALVRVRQGTIAQPEHAGPGSGRVCAKDVGASISLGAGTSVIVRIPNACSRCGAGRRPAGRLHTAWVPTPEPGTPWPKESDVSEPKLRLRPLRSPKLSPRVVTQQNLFFTSSLRPARLSRTPCSLASQSSTLLLPDLSSVSSQRPGS
jgi:hypothetical protein